MNVLQFSGFRSDEIKHVFLYGINYISAQRGVYTIGIMQGLSKDVRALCLLGWPESIVSEDGLGSISCGRMLRNDEEYKEYLEDIEPYPWGPCRVFEIFA
nr:CNT_HP1_G0014930.mRNA.1.CDS.1 [Saccharomyces cerevisiae]